MEIVTYFVDFILHVDKDLENFVHLYGNWVYALLFLIIFVETGVVVMPFLPGDSLLFVVGALCGLGLMSWPLTVSLLWLAAVLGNQCNYTIGRYFGPQVFRWEHSRLFNKNAFNQAHAFYEKYGGITIVAARFMPFLRTFAPFVAGVAQINACATDPKPPRAWPGLAIHRHRNDDLAHAAAAGAAARPNTAVARYVR